MATPSPHPTQIILRVAASLLGGYSFVWSFCAFGMAASVALGMRYHDAEQLFHLLSFLLFPVCFCWAFVTRGLLWVWATLVGGAALMAFAAWLIARALI